MTLDATVEEAEACVDADHVWVRVRDPVKRMRRLGSKPGWTDSAIVKVSESVKVIRRNFVTNRLVEVAQHLAQAAHNLAQVANNFVQTAHDLAGPNGLVQAAHSVTQAANNFVQVSRALQMDNDVDTDADTLVQEP
ncbi:hypothetical protein N0V85_008004 [Neurospora sp. IMI 360204]|nr:hypothetical protein N0V85_008004 [Neurospora sp. IMI 360204]